MQLQRCRTRGWQHHQPALAGPQNWVSEDFAAAAAVAAAAAAAAAATADAALHASYSRCLEAIPVVAMHVMRLHAAVLLSKRKPLLSDAVKQIGVHAICLTRRL